MVVSKQAAVFAALVEAHVYDFEGHVLGAVVAHEGSGQDVAKAELKLELHMRPRGEVTADGSDPAREAGGFNLKTAVFLEVGAHGGDSLMQTDTRVAPLADKL
jgi:hypothetical protein